MQVRTTSAVVLLAVALTGCQSSSGSHAVHQLRAPATTETPAAIPSPSPAFTPARPLIARAYWVHYPEGWRIRIKPSIYGRNYAPEAVHAAFAEAIRLARPTPLKLTPSIRRSLFNQLRCHADFAPRKPLWDLEAWRPAIGYFQTVAALCNPGGGA